LQIDWPVEPSDIVACGVPINHSTPGPVAALIDQPMKEAKEAVVGEFERVYLVEVLNHSGGNVSQAARLSGKHRRAFFELMRKHGISGDTYRAKSIG
jgi:DNA-binding NtrC family response regulator